MTRGAIGAPRHRRRAAKAAPAAAAATAAQSGDAREHWAADAGSRDVAALHIPPHAQRERSFEIFCRLEVANRSGHADATHGLRVLVDGALAWSREVPTDAGGADSLDFRLRRSVPAGQPLRVTASATTRRAQQTRLTITADEE